MRLFCPVCNSSDRVSDWSMDFIVPDGWTECPTHNEVCLCQSCGMIYYDNDKSQADYDAYYKNRFHDWSLSTPNNLARLDELVELACEEVPDKNACIVDFGGGDESYITKRLTERGYVNCHSVGVGDELPTGIDLLISSHVFEHIYDVRASMDMLTAHVRGKFLIELPDTEWQPRSDHPILDYSQKHINHYTPHVLDRLFYQYGYTQQYNKRMMIGSHQNYAYRVVYERIEAYHASHARVDAGIAPMIERLKQIHEPVIVWGLGDIAMHLLTKVKLDVVHYVDFEPQYKGAYIGGVPVFGYVRPGSHYPIVIICFLAADAIQKQIRDAGLKNRVIVI